MESNTICVNLRINRNQDPKLFELLTKAENKSGAIRELLSQAMKENNTAYTKESVR